MESKPFSILFVCMGNICRSPLAEGVLRKMIQATELEHTVKIDSAGTHFYHTGEPADPRSRAVGQQYNYPIEDLRARQVALEDFETFDWIVAMDRRNLRDLKSICPQQHQHKLLLFLETFAPELDPTEVPDPYHGGEDGFVNVLGMVEAGCQGLIKQLRQQQRPIVNF
ncbi:MAG: low molecular weight protein-tyrosine-phosphatase [Candidatus Melainabacteria bacterium]|nr:low molecular weight protein-tyrosine-phosphatase [Candidatus Melainabacteria bacterium]